MTDEPSDRELQRLLQFSSDDLALNQAGRLSLLQRVQMLPEMDYLFLLFVVLLPIWMAAWLIGAVPFIQVMMVVVMILITGLLDQRSVRTLLDVIIGQVDQVSGVTTIRIFTHDQRTFLGLMGKQFANGTINDITFHLPLELAHQVQGKSLRVYYTPRYRKAVAAKYLT